MYLPKVIKLSAQISDISQALRSILLNITDIRCYRYVCWLKETVHMVKLQHFLYVYLYRQILVNFKYLNDK